MKRMKLKDNKKFKIFIGVILIILLGIGSFGFGTFKPNNYIIDKITERVELEQSKIAVKLGLHEPEFVYTDQQSFILAVRKCVNYINFTTPHSLRIPSLLIEAQAGLESGWGTSRFAIEGNALFGVRTWDPKLPQIKPKDNPKAVWGVKVYKTKCQSIQDYVDLLNSHPAYKDFRELREEMVIAGIYNYEKLIDTLTLFSTNPNYTTLLKATVNKLKVITAN